MQLPAQHDLPLGDVARQVRDGVGDVVVGHRQHGKLRHRARLALEHTGALEDGGEVRVHVRGVPAPPGDLLACGRHLAQGLAVVGDVGHHDEHVHAVHEGQVLGAGEAGPRGEQALDGRVLRLVQEQNRALERRAGGETVEEGPGLALGDSRPPRTRRRRARRAGARALSTIVAASSSAGRPGPENTGSFWPRTRVFMPSMAEMPVSMKSLGGSRRTGLIGAPQKGRSASPMGGGRPSRGCPTPLSARPEQVPTDDLLRQLAGEGHEGRRR